MFKALKYEIDAGNELQCVLMLADAKELSLNGGDRIKIINKRNNLFIICVLDVVNGNAKKKDVYLKRGEIGIYEKPFEKLEILEGDYVDIVPAKKPKSLEYVKLKSDGKRLTEPEFKEIMIDIVENRYSEIETTFFVISCYVHKLDDSETVNLTNAMVNVGKVLDFTSKNEVVVDKHCIGGIPGNRTSMVVVPIVAAAGLVVPKSSSRAITSPAGTADTMEVLADVSLSTSKMYNQVNEIGGCIVWGGGLDLSPADDLIIHVEHPLEIDSEGQMIASILSKKKSVGSTHVLLDIPVGKTAKVKTMKHANRLKKRFEKISKAIGLKAKVIITDGSEPIGSGIGPLYEALDVLKVLKNEEVCPIELREKSLFMAGEMFELAGVAKVGRGYEMAHEILTSGKAYRKFEEIIDYQGRAKKTAHGKYHFDVLALESGSVKEIYNTKVAKLAFILGAPQDKSAGLILKKKMNAIVEKGDVLFRMYTNSELKLKYAQAYLKENPLFDVE